MTSAYADSHSHRLGLLRMTLTGASVLGLLVAGCWLAAAVLGDLSMTHNFVGLFTGQPVNSPAALGEGVAWAVVLGGLSGALIAGFYNLFGRVGR
ncbi:MAG TPA: hypothetical protein VF122_07510 [Caulobacteraceae bacterium]